MQIPMKRRRSRSQPRMRFETPAQSAWCSQNIKQVSLGPSEWLQFFYTVQDDVGYHRDHDDEIADPGEEKRERLAINFGQLQEENRTHGANHTKHDLDRQKRDPVPRERARHVQAAAGELERNDKVAHREAGNHNDEQ